MDAITTIVVTVLANAVVTGIIVYLIQKKFEVKFQKSLFEHQTRFSRIYQDRVETLANLYQKFTTYKKDFSHVVEEASKLGYRPERISTTVSALIQENRQKYDDFASYFENNRLYLSDSTCAQIYDLIARHDLMGMAIFMFSDDIPEGFIKVANNAIRTLKFEIDIESDFEKPDFLSLIWQIEKEVHAQAERLEKLYRSVAEAQ